MLRLFPALLLAIAVLWIIYQANHVYEGRLKSFRDGSEYIGSIKNNMPFGQGKLIRPDGSIWEGNFDSWTTGSFTIRMNGLVYTGFKN